MIVSTLGFKKEYPTRCLLKTKSITIASPNMNAIVIFSKY